MDPSQDDPNAPTSPAAARAASEGDDEVVPVVAVTGAGLRPRRTTAPEAPGTRAKLEEGCPCGCDRSKAMAAELLEVGGDAARETLEATLQIIAEREDAGYITEAMVEHRLRLLEVGERLAGARETGRAALGLGATPAGDHGDALPSGGGALEYAGVVEDGRLRVRTDLYAHGQATEIVRGHEKLLRASFLLGMEIENLTTTKLTLQEPVLDGRVSLPVSRWYRVGGDGRRWDGVLEAGEKCRVNVIGYLGEPVKPGTEIEATLHIDALVIHASTRARRRWNRAE